MWNKDDGDKISETMDLAPERVFYMLECKYTLKQIYARRDYERRKLGIKGSQKHFNKGEIISSGDRNIVYLEDAAKLIGAIKVGEGSYFLDGRRILICEIMRRVNTRLKDEFR